MPEHPKKIPSVFSSIIKAGRVGRALKKKKLHAEKVRVKIQPSYDIYGDPKSIPKQDIFRSFQFTIKKGKKQVHGEGSYSPHYKGVYVDYIGDPKAMRKYRTVEKAHRETRGKSMDYSMVKGALEKISKIFPKAEVVEGGRVTGAKAKSKESFGTQTFKLKRFLRKIK